MRALIFVALSAACAFLGGCGAIYSICKAPSEGHYYIAKANVGLLGMATFPEIEEYRVDENGKFVFVRDVK